MLANAVRICEAKFGTMFLREGDAFRTVALHNAPPAYVELRTAQSGNPSSPVNRPFSSRRDEASGPYPRHFGGSGVSRGRSEFRRHL